MTEYQNFLRAANAGVPGLDAMTALVTTGTAAFDAIRISAEANTGADSEMFAAWMMVAAEAADGRDALVSALSARPSQLAAIAPLGRAEIASLAGDLATALQDAADQAAGTDDATALRRAAACAGRTRDLMAGDAS